MNGDIVNININVSKEVVKDLVPRIMEVLQKNHFVVPHEIDGGILPLSKDNGETCTHVVLEIPAVSLSNGKADIAMAIARALESESKALVSRAEHYREENE